MSCWAIAWRYSRWPGVFAWITRRSPGRMILYSPVAGAPTVPRAPSPTTRSTSVTSSWSPMRARSTSASATCAARSTAVTAPCRVSVSPRSDTRTPRSLASSIRLPSLTPARARGSTPSAETRCVTSSLIASPRCAAWPGPPERRGPARPRTGRGRPSSSGRRSRRAARPRRRAASPPDRSRSRSRRAAAHRRRAPRAGSRTAPPHGGVHDANRAGAELVAVVDRVVVQRPAGQWVGLELGDILRVRRRERVMREHGSPRFGVKLEQREVHHPAERVRRLRSGREPADHLLTHLVEYGRGDAVGAHGHQRHVPVADPEAAERLRREMLPDRARDLLALALHPREPGAAQLLRHLGELIHVLPRQRASPFHGEPAHPGAVLHGGLKERHPQRPDQRRPVGDRQVVALVGLVRAIALHRFTMRQSREGPPDRVPPLVP